MDRIVRLAVLADIREASERLDRIGARVEALTARPHDIRMQLKRIPSNDLRSAEAQAELSGRRIGSKLSSGLKGVVDKTGKFALAGLAVGFGMAIKSTIEFQGSMEKIHQLVGVGGKDLEDLSNGVLNLAKVSGVGPKELADALYYVTSAGFRGAGAMEVMTAAAKAAAAGLGSTKDVADAVTSALNAYHGTGLKAADVTDTLVAAVREGKMPVTALASAIGPVIGVSAEMGVKFSEVAGAAAALSRSGVPVNKTMTGLRFMMTSLANPTSAAAKVLGSVGIQASDLRKEIREKGLLATLTDLKNKLPIEDFMKVMGGARGLTVALGLVGKNAAQVRDVMAGVGHAAGSTDKAFEAASETVEFRFHKALSSLTAVGIQLGSVLMPVLAAILGVVSKIAGNKPLLIAFSITLGAVAAAWIGVQISALAAAIAENAALLFIPAAIELVIVAIVLLVSHWKTVKGWFVNVWEWLKAHEWVTLFLPMVFVIVEIGKHWRGLWTLLKDLWSLMKAGWHLLCDVFTGRWSNAYQDIVHSWHSLNKTWNDITGNMRRIGKLAFDYIRLAGLQAVDFILKGFSHIPFIGHYFRTAEGQVHSWMNSIQHDINGLNGRNVNVGANFRITKASYHFGPGGFATFQAGGGPIRGPGTETSDSVPVWASRNEYMVNAAAHRKYGTAFLDDINTRRLAAGGPVDLLQARAKLTPSSAAVGNIVASVMTSLTNQWAKAAGKSILASLGGPAIIQYARQFVGKVPYVWGGTSPSGWDCSGFTSYVYHHFGYSGIPRTSQSQWGWVRRTPRPVPGGLAFFAGGDGTVGSPGHVGIVAGPNLMIDAYGTGFGTRYDVIYGSAGPVSGFGVAPGPPTTPRGFARGGVIRERILGLGVSGTSYTFGENGPELVAPLHGPGTRRMGSAGDCIIINFNGLVTDPDGTARKVHQILRDYKRHKGGQPLGIG